jgi:glyoxylase-like metal-dependent hydrolase (beta-lactamase superfamily II)
LSPLPPPDRELVPGETVRVGLEELEVRYTPGHAPGHVILYSATGGFALVGDVIFAGTIGRTDLPGGDFLRLMRSIREEVLTLPDETRLLLGHGPETTVGRERMGNPFLISQAPGRFA